MKFFIPDANVASNKLLWYTYQQNWIQTAIQDSDRVYSA